TISFTKRMAVLTLGLAAVSTAMAQQNYPDRAIRFIVPPAAGGSPDVLSRVIADALSQELGQSIVVEDKAGAAGNIGIVQSKDGAPDVYTIGYGNINTLSVNRSLFKSLPYDVNSDLVPVGQMFSLYNVLLVSNESPFSSLNDLVTHAKQNPGKLSYGAPGVG